MKLKNPIKNEEGAAPCKNCLHKHNILVYPKVVDVEDLYYAQCPKCTAFDRYEFLGRSRKRSIENWNRAMEAKQCDEEFL